MFKSSLYEKAVLLFLIMAAIVLTVVFLLGSICSVIERDFIATIFCILASIVSTKAFIQLFGDLRRVQRFNDK